MGGGRITFEYTSLLPGTSFRFLVSFPLNPYIADADADADADALI